MEDIVPVTDFDRTTNVTFWKTNLMCGASLGANVYQRHDTYVDIEFLPGRVIG